MAGKIIAWTHTNKLQSSNINKNVDLDISEPKASTHHLILWPWIKYTSLFRTKFVSYI